MSYPFDSLKRAAFQILHHAQSRNIGVPFIPEPASSIRPNSSVPGSGTEAIVKIESDRDDFHASISIQFSYRRTDDDGIAAMYVGSVINDGREPVDFYGTARDDGFGHITTELHLGVMPTSVSPAD